MNYKDTLEKFAWLEERIDCLYEENLELKQQLEMLRFAVLRNKFQHTQPIGQGCSVCGLGSEGKAWGYVCNNSGCPTRVTC